MVQPPASSGNPMPGDPGSLPPAPAAIGLDPRRTGRWRIVLVALVISFCALAIIGIVTYVGWRIGPLALGIGIAGAILPVPVLVACFLWLDRYDPSPIWIILISFLWGAGVATSGALFLNDWASTLFARHHWSDNLVAMFFAPVVEETLKAAFPLLLFVFYRRAFTGIIDGIVYCGLSATGFAMVENILYLGGYGFAPEAGKGYAAGALAVTTIFIVRVPLTGFAHPLFTSMTGIGLGIAARSPRRSVRIFAPLIGLLTAMVLHGSWNTMSVLAQDEPYFILYGYFAVFMPIFFGMLGFVLWLRSWEGRLTERILPVYMSAGWFSPPEVAALGTLGRRLSARKWAARVAGDAGQTAMRGYQFAATRLALLRDGLNRGLYANSRDLAKTVHEERRLLDAIDAYRRIFVGRDPLTPRAWWNAGAYQIQFPDGVIRTIAAPPLPVVPIPFAFSAASPGPYGSSFPAPMPPYSSGPTGPSATSYGSGPTGQVPPYGSGPIAPSATSYGSGPTGQVPPYGSGPPTTSYGSIPTGPVPPYGTSPTGPVPPYGTSPTGPSSTSYVSAPSPYAPMPAPAAEPWVAMPAPQPQPGAVSPQPEPWAVSPQPEPWAAPEPLAAPPTIPAVPPVPPASAWDSPWRPPDAGPKP